MADPGPDQPTGDADPSGDDPDAGPGARTPPGPGLDPAVVELEQRRRRAELQARLDHEWRVAMVIAVALLVVGQVLLVLGWWPLALAVVAVPGTAAAVALLRRWRRLAADDGWGDGDPTGT